MEESEEAHLKLENARGEAKVLVEKAEREARETEILSKKAAEEKAAAILKETEKIFEERLGKNIKYKPCEDENIIGGYVAEGGGLRVDSSFKSALLSLYQKIKQN